MEISVGDKEYLQNRQVRCTAEVQTDERTDGQTGGPTDRLTRIRNKKLYFRLS